MKEYVFLVQMHSHVWTGLVIRGYVWYFGFLRRLFDISYYAKKQSSFWKRGLRHFAMCTIVLNVSVQNF